MTDLDLLPPDLQQLFQLFSSLPDVRFPELDPVALQTAVARVKERHLEVVALEAQLSAIRGALDVEQAVLLRSGHRLLAYLRIFAAQDPVLLEKMSGLSLPRLPESAPGVVGEAPRRRGRPRKVPTSDLFPTPVAETSAA